MKKIRTVLTIAAAVFVLLFSSSYASLPEGAGVWADNVSLEQTSAAGTVILDDSEARVLLLNPDGKCIKVFESKAQSDQVTYYSSADITDDSLYISEYTRTSGSSYVDSEQLVRYDLNGKKIGTVFSCSHDSGDRTQEASIYTIRIYDGKGEALLLNAFAQKIYVYRFDPCAENQVCEIGSPDLQELPAPFSDGLIVSALFDENDPETVIAQSADNQFAFLSLQDEKPAFTPAQSDISGRNYTVSLQLDDNNRVTAQNAGESAAEDSFYPYTVGTIVLQNVYRLCCTWLVLFAIFLLVKALLKIFRNKEFNRLKNPIICLLIILACGFITGYYTIHLMMDEKEDQDTMLQGAVTVLYTSEQDLLDKCLNDYSADGKLDTANQLELERLLEECSYNISRIGESAVFSLGAPDDTGEVYILADSTILSLAGYDSGVNLNSYGPIEDWVVSSDYSDSWTEARYCALEIYNPDGSIKGVLFAETDSNVLTEQIYSECLLTFFNLLSMAIVAGFVLMEAKEWIDGFRERRRRKQEGLPHPETALMHPAVFADAMAGGVNSILLSVIAKEMAEQAGLDHNAFLMALPVMVFSLGFLIGGELGPLLLRRFPLKKTLLLSAVVAIAGYALDAYCILTSNLVLFAFGILVTHIPLGITHLYVFNMAFDAPTQEERARLNRSAAAAVISGSSLAGSLAGILADHLGNVSIEILGMILSALFLLFLMNMVPKDEQFTAGNAKTAARERIGVGDSIVRFLKDGPTLSVMLLVSLPLTIAVGYKSYLFPIFSTDAGMDKSLVSMIVVFCSALVYFLTPSISKIESRTGSRKTMVLSGIALSTVLILFAVNRTSAWLIIALVVVVLANKIITPAVVSFWQKRAAANKVDGGIASGVATLFRYGGQTLQSPVYAYGLNLAGATATCVFIGFFFLAATLLFAVSQRFFAKRAG